MDILSEGRIKYRGLENMNGLRIGRRREIFSAVNSREKRASISGKCIGKKTQS